ncbi:hypothetical protein BDW02DRAFT_505906 [Decorospora gaudefroyi]|uniref:SP-RING-type domain-containing protein n=1 Tax=Decorospora gaudefroyi TaxID=184978 RepID=A0A6A5KCT1_9PLEO|nr:hypothetical protein BDW02DRAFT_505906 [Decorospora gaudefroyi]
MVQSHPPAGDATAHTLNYALGNLGGRQKSWMVLPSNAPPLSPVAPAEVTQQPLPFAAHERGRPRKQLAVAAGLPLPPPPQGQAADAAHPTVEQQPSSSSTSPQLANVVAHHPSTSHGPPATVFASPAPSEEQMGAVSASQTPPQPQGPFTCPRPLSRVVNRHSPSVLIEGGHASIPQAGASTQPSPTLSKTWYTQEWCLYLLQNFQLSRPASPDHSEDTLRLRVLRMAVEEKDWVYLTYHQYYCMLSSTPEVLPKSLLGLPTLDQARRVMCDVLDSNRKLSADILHFFCNYPLPVLELGALWSAESLRHAQLFSVFVAQSKNCDQLMQLCQRRKCPPLARELFVVLGIASVTFQRLVFTASLRRIWGTKPNHARQQSLESQAIDLFKQNQLEFYQQAAHIQTQNAAQVEELEVQAFAAKLRGLVPLANPNDTSAVSQQQQSLAYPSGYQPTQKSHWRPPQPHGNSFLSPYPIEMPPHQNSTLNPHSAPAAIQQSRPRGRPSTRPLQPHQTSAPQSAPQSAPPAQQLQNRRPLLPPAGTKQPLQRVPNPSRFSLHQAHLQSPALRAKSASSPLYTSHDGYMKLPTRLSDAGRAIERWTFTLSPATMQMLPQTVPTTEGGVGARDVDESSKLARLRCVKWPVSELPTEHAWAVSETSWIPNSYFRLNGTYLEQRKKLHHGKDLPIDITGLLKEGENVLEVTVMAPSGDTSHLNYLLAIERIGVSSHESIKQNCLNQNRLSAEEVLQSIKSKLSGAGDDDDDLSIVESSLTIAMFDPFSQTNICKTPVRSKACLHNDCFDLEVFLKSRARRGGASVPDQWKCPICKADARPHLLFVDSFMEDVGRQLEARGLSRTRQIIVNQDGSWKPKAEVREGVSDRRASNISFTPNPAKATSAPAEIIDLSD